MKRILSMVLLLMTITAHAQNKYCCSYEEFVNNQWESLNYIEANTHSKSHQLWWGGNDYKFTTGDNATDKILKKQAFAVMIGDTLYLNCRNLRFDGANFGNGYTKAKRIGKRSLLIVNRINGKNVNSSVNTASFFFGIIGGAIAASDVMKTQVCYVISSGAGSNGKIGIRMIDDNLMDQMLADHNELRYKYYDERDGEKRMLAKHIIPILEEAGLFNQASSNSQQ